MLKVVQLRFIFYYFYIEITQVFLLGVALAGAGGGGFLYALLKSSESKEQIEQIVQSLNMEVYRAEISKDGIEFNHIN